jgi:hypothetical protein
LYPQSLYTKGNEILYVLKVKPKEREGEMEKSEPNLNTMADKKKL